MRAGAVRLERGDDLPIVRSRNHRRLLKFLGCS